MTVQQPDSLRAILDSVFARADYKWIERPEPLATLRYAWAAFKHWFASLNDAHPLGFHVLVYLLLALVLALVLHAGWTFFTTVGSADTSVADTPPGFIPHGPAWYRAEADRLATAGRFVEAIQLDFLALVLALDARSILRFHPSKTPGEYARESRLTPAAREEFRELVRRLYRYAFARSPCGPDEFADWRSRAAPERYASAN